MTSHYVIFFKAVWRAGPGRRGIPECDRGSFLDEVCAALRPALCDESGKWTADYVRLRFRAGKPTPRRWEEE